MTPCPTKYNLHVIVNVKVLGKSLTEKPSWTIGQLADDLDVSTRSIRFYEEKGLLKPARSAGRYRVYDKRDRARLKLILRGKRFGMTLDEILEVLGLATVDMDETRTDPKGHQVRYEIMDDLVQRMTELRAMQDEMLIIKDPAVSPVVRNWKVRNRHWNRMSDRAANREVKTEMVC